MKITFDDNSYLEIRMSSVGKIQIILSAKDGKNSNNEVINSVEISQQQFREIFNEVLSENKE